MNNFIYVCIYLFLFNIVLIKSYNQRTLLFHFEYYKVNNRLVEQSDNFSSLSAIEVNAQAWEIASNFKTKKLYRSQWDLHSDGASVKASTDITLAIIGLLYLKLQVSFHYILWVTTRWPSYFDELTRSFTEKYL